MSTTMTLDIRGLNALIRKIEAESGDTKVKKALRPAAKIVRKSIQSEARVGSGYPSNRPPPGRLKRAVKVKAVRSKPILLVAAVRELALSASAKYPKFPYINWIAGDKKSALGDKFVARGLKKAEATALGAAQAGLLAMLRSTGRIK